MNVKIKMHGRESNSYLFYSVNMFTEFALPHLFYNQVIKIFVIQILKANIGTIVLRHVKYHAILFILFLSFCRSRYR